MENPPKHVVYFGNNFVEIGPRAGVYGPNELKIGPGYSPDMLLCPALELCF